MKLLQFLCVLHLWVASVDMASLRVVQMDEEGTEDVGTLPCFPAQWESILNTETVTYSGPYKSVEDTIQEKSYDYTNRRMKTTITKMINAVVESIYTYITIYSKENQGVRYELNEFSGECTAVPLTEPMLHDCLLPNTKSGSKRRIGYNPTLEIHNYVLVKKNFYYQIQAQDKPDNIIIPIIEYDQRIDDKGTHIINNYEYVDFSLGIKDPAIFAEPKECKQVKRLKRETSSLRGLKKILKG